MVAPTKPLLLAFSVVLFGLLLAVKVQADFTTDIGSKRYLIKNGKKVNWLQANHACTLAGMSLTSIESEEERTNLKNYLFSKNLLSKSFWLGASNLADSTNLVYTWLWTGNQLDYTKWQSGKPVSTNTGHCIFTDADFMWDTEECATTTKTKYFICSRPLVPNCGITGRCKINRNFYY